MITTEQFLKAVEAVRALDSSRKDKIKFDQTFDLIINLRNFDISRTPINIFVNVPHKVKDKKIAAFLEKKSTVIDTITKEQFDNFKDKKKLKSLVNEYDFFIASGKLMPAVATSFGRVLGPASKMPSPSLGVVMVESDEAITAAKKKIENSVKVRAKEPSIKVAIGKQKAKDTEIAENCAAVFNDVFKLLPRNKENVRSVMVKLTMTKPVKVQF